ncbi:MAG: hypothetical protein HC899_40110, partial [Leptolyngbyaceae cyanobacterium SM1_4_3]|nr:hypothetical protein [Leptolyngbyaceae cyanobacterium SM1_4_3]
MRSAVEIGVSGLRRRPLRKALSDTNLGGTKLSNTDLSDAVLLRTNLQDTDLSGADLRAAKVEPATLQKARLCSTTMPDRTKKPECLTGGLVDTQSGLGLNIRSGPGLNYPVIGGADDGVALEVVGAPV